MPKCLVCENSIEPFISFGKMPIANGFLAQEQFSQEYYFELKIGFCSNCTMVQLTELVDETKMFHANYPFYSSTSTRMTEHFTLFANDIIEKHLKEPDPFVVEIGSNDGIMLQNFSNKTIRHLGIEPSANVAQIAREKGINTICSFFNEKLAREIVLENGHADIFLGANVMCHIPYLHSVAEGIRILLKPKGLLVFEDPYLGDIFEKTSYDQIYDEHAFYFSVNSVNYLFGQHGLEIIDVQPQNVHGGSMRYVLAHKGSFKIKESVVNQMKKENILGLDKSGTYENLKKNIEKNREELIQLLQSLKKDNKRVVGYAATSKSTTVINYCGITPDLVEFISDTTPIKQGKYSPGMHIPIRPYEEFKRNFPAYALLFGWNHAEEIMAKEKDFVASGGKWIFYVPKVRI